MSSWCLQAHVEGRQRNAIVFSGCGTSGRVAWLCVRELNTILRTWHANVADVFRYHISGECGMIEF